MQNSQEQQLRRDSPFQGPRPFAREDTDWFFGRADETDQLLSLILGHKVVLVYAQSGAGKTSLLNAKIIPELEGNELQVLPVARVGGYQGLRGPQDIDNSEFEMANEKLDSAISNVHILNPFMYNAIQSIIDINAQKTHDSSSLLSDVTTFSDFLEKKIIQEGFKKGTKRKKPIVIIFDQLEELFRASIYSSYEMQKDFFYQIANALDKDNLSRVVLVIREDYLAHLDPFREILPEKLRPRFRLEPLDKDEAKDAIEKPLEKSKEYFKDHDISNHLDKLLKLSYKDFSSRDAVGAKRQAESQSLSLVDKIVKSLSTMRFELPNGSTAEVIGQFVEPIYLQVVGQRLWENLKTARGIDSSLDYLEDIGDVDKALVDFYEMTIREAAEITGIYEGDIRIWLESRLITSSGTRGNVHRGHKWTSGIPNQVLDFLDEKHLIRAEAHFGGLWYELTHDRMIKPLLDSNIKWRYQLQQVLRHKKFLYVILGKLLAIYQNLRSHKFVLC
jgi:hypothetical protein